MGLLTLAVCPIVFKQHMKRKVIAGRSDLVAMGASLFESKITFEVMLIKYTKDAGSRM